MEHPIEKNFPFQLIDALARAESHRKEIYRPLYHIHKWWAKRLGSVFRAIVSGSLAWERWPDFYLEQDYSNKVVLDPFMGSGTSLGEALKLGARVVGCDVNPVSTFMVRRALSRVSAVELEEELSSIAKDVGARIQSYYMTRLPGQAALSPVLYYFWVKTVTTPTEEVIPLFSSYVFSKNAYPRRKPRARILCPNCGAVLIGLYNSIYESCTGCCHVFDPQKGPAKNSKVTDSKGKEYKIKDLIQRARGAPRHRMFALLTLDDKGEKVYRSVGSFDIALYEQARQELVRISERLPLPDMLVRSGHNTDQARSYGYLSWSDFFNQRQLLCLGLLYERILKIGEARVRDQFICLFSGLLEFNNMFCSFKGEGTGAVRHMFSHHILKPERTPLESCIWGFPTRSSGTFLSLFKSRLLKAKAYLDEPFELKINEKGVKKVLCSKAIDVKVVTDWESFRDSSGSALILNGDSTKLPLPEESVDAIVTDPPYFDFVHYSELSDFFYAWLCKAPLEDSVLFAGDSSRHENEVQDKDMNLFIQKIQGVFAECRRVMKAGAVLCFSYHHSRIEGWLGLFGAIQRAGLSIVAAHPIKSELAASTTKSSSAKPIDIDAIFVCKKSAPLSVEAPEARMSRLITQVLDVFEKLERPLGEGDRFVLVCSQALVVASRSHMEVGEARLFLEAQVKRWIHGE